MAVITSPNYAGSLIGALNSAKKKTTTTPTQSKTVLASSAPDIGMGTYLGTKRAVNTVGLPTQMLFSSFRDC